MADSSDPRPYHHGDLRNALIEAALAVVERGGAEAVSLRELAADLSVSRAAPYRHFPDKDALLAAVAARGFEDLNAVYETALRGPGGPLDHMRATARVFFDFARDRPGLFQLMLESDLLTRKEPPAVLLGPADRSYRLLWDLVREVYPGADEREIKSRTLTMWATIYGYLALKRAKRIKPFMIEPLTTEELEEAILRAALPQHG